MGHAPVVKTETLTSSKFAPSGCASLNSRVKSPDMSISLNILSILLVNVKPQSSLSLLMNVSSLSSLAERLFNNLFDKCWR